MIRKRRILAAIALGIFLGIFGRTLQDIYIDYHSAKGLVAASGRPVGGDFVCLYLAGQAASQNPKALYDWENGRKRQLALLDTPDGKEWILPYAYPPLFALLLIPFSKLSFIPASVAWIGFSLFLAFSSVFLVLSQSRFDNRQRALAALLLLVFTPFTLDCLAGGQTSAIGMLIFAAVYYLTKVEREFAAGLVLGFGYYKPPLFFAFAVTLLLQKRWKLLGGALLSGTALLLLSVIYLGPTGFMAYLERMSRYVYGRTLLPGISLPPGKGVGFLAFLASNLPGKIMVAWGIYLAILVLALGFFSSAVSRLDPAAKKDRAYDLSFSLSSSLSLLFSVQMLNYDISIFFILILLTAEPIIRLANRVALLLGGTLSILFFLVPQIGSIELAGILINPAMVLMVCWIIFLFYLVNNESLVDNTRL